MFLLLGLHKGTQKKVQKDKHTGEPSKLSAKNPILAAPKIGPFLDQGLGVWSLLDGLGCKPSELEVNAAVWGATRNADNPKPSTLNPEHSSLNIKSDNS